MIDTPTDTTSAYSPEGFHTYIIGPEGNLLADLPGTKMKRPGPKKILAALADAKQTAASVHVAVAFAPVRIFILYVLSVLLKAMRERDVIVAVLQETMARE